LMFIKEEDPLKGLRESLGIPDLSKTLADKGMGAPKDWWIKPKGTPVSDEQRKIGQGVIAQAAGEDAEPGVGVNAIDTKAFAKAEKEIAQFHNTMAESIRLFGLTAEEVRKVKFGDAIADAFLLGNTILAAQLDMQEQILTEMEHNAARKLEAAKQLKDDLAKIGDEAAEAFQRQLQDRADVRMGIEVEFEGLDDNFADMQNRGEQLMEKFLLPEVKLQKQIEDIQQLLQINAIDLGTAERALQSYEVSAMEKRKLPPGAIVGTQEALNVAREADQQGKDPMDNLLKAALEQVRHAKRQADEAEKLRKAVEEIKIVEAKP